MKYTHSRTFAELKAIKEDLDENLTSAQYLHTLDYLLWNAIAPIARSCPTLFKAFISKCVAYQTRNPNSKFSSGDKADLPLLLFKALQEEDPTEVLKHVRNMYLNRGLTFGLVSMFLNMTQEYKTLGSAQSVNMKRTDRLFRMNKIEDNLGATHPLFEVITEVEYWAEKAHKWRDVIMQKFVRMMNNAAQATYVDYNHVVPLDDVTQIYLVVGSRAINRCDARMGVLTTFIQQWLKSARAKVAELAAHHDDESLEALQDTLGDSLSLGAVDPDRSAELLRSVSWAAFKADPVGLVRTAMGIPQYVTALQRTELLKASRNRK